LRGIARPESVVSKVPAMMLRFLKMAKMQESRGEVDAAIKSECAELGFKKRDPVFFTRQFTPDVLGVMALVQHTYGQELSIVPQAGVRHQPLERLIAELAGTKFHPYIGGTLGCGFGSLSPLNEYLTYNIPVGTDPAPSIRDLFQVVRNVVIPWMEGFRDLDSFMPDLQTYQYGARTEMQMRRTVVRYLRGEYDEVRSLVAQYLPEASEEEGFPRLADTLLARLPSRTGEQSPIIGVGDQTCP
jgi:hypothetical protein